MFIMAVFGGHAISENWSPH